MKIKMGRRAKLNFLLFLALWVVILLILMRQKISHLDNEYEALQQSHFEQPLRTFDENTKSANKPKDRPKQASHIQDSFSQTTKVVETEWLLDGHLEHPARFRDFFQKMYTSHVDVGLDNVKDPSRYLIYRCDTLTMTGCGGWVDRLRGFMAGYIIANLTGRVFKSEMLMPSCDIQKFIIPNLVNWSLPISFHRRVDVDESKDVKKLIYTNDKTFWKKAKTVDFRALPAMKAKYVYFQSNLDYMDGFKNSIHFQSQVSWMKNLTLDQINAVIFKRLFKLPRQVQVKLNSFLADNLRPSNRLVCIHIRIGRNPTIPHDNVDRVREMDVPRIWNFLQGITKDPTDKVFIMSDSENVLKSARNQSFLRDKLFFTSGKIVHVENSKGIPASEKCAGIEKVVIEQFILMHCDALVICKSGMSRMAAYLRGNDQDLYCVLDKGLVVPCKTRNVQQLYGIMG